MPNPGDVVTFANCACCSSSSSSSKGSSSSSSSSSGCISTSCCSCVPSTLHCTFTLGVGTDCSTHCGSFTAAGAWDGTQWNFSGTFACGISITAKLKCVGGVWSMLVTGCGFTDSAMNLMSASCTPFDIEWNASFSSNCCPGGGAVSGLTASVTA